MRCPKCEFENKEIAKFCEECGARLARSCPNCDEEVGPRAKFCPECGHNLAFSPEAKLPPKELTPEDKLAKIQRYLPQGIADKILSHRDRIEGERKQVTVMFCDLEGFTVLTEKLGPEDAYALMDQVYEILIHKVHDFEGTVNEMTGDGVMALFGAPVALEDAPQRAIRSALAIHREMVRFNDRVKPERPGLPELKMRVGIHTGPVVVGTLGNDLRVEFKAVGDTVNLASRMEGLAEPGTTYATDDTFRLTEGLFRFEGLGEREIKGKEEPVLAYRVIGPSTRRTRFDVSAERGLTPFVGRERELELLLDAFERAKEGRGQSVSIVAPAGDGKSRVLYEFRKGVANEEVTFLEGKCLSYSGGISYHPVIDILKGNFDIREGDSHESVRDKVQRGLQVLESDDGATTPYLLELLSVKESGIDLTLSPEARKDRTIQALNRIVLRGSEIRPLILSVEDLHWMDPNSEEAFRDLFEHIAGARVLLIFTYRTEYVHTWGSRSYHSQITLNRLSNRETLAIVAHLLGTNDVGEDLADLILAKTEGVPFFIEEFVKSLRDLRIIDRRDQNHVLTRDPQDVTIPSTIQDVIMARVDALPEGAKETLQAGSVIEREFSHELLCQFTDLSERELLSSLSVLKDAELIYERGIYPESTYVFKHALTREVIYDSILNRRKKELHDAIARAMEQLYQNKLDEHYGALSRHYSVSDNYEKAAEYYRLAGKAAGKIFSINDAIGYAEKRVGCLVKLPPTEKIEKEIVDARTTLGLYYLQKDHYIEANNAVAPIIDLALRLKYKRRISQIHSIMGSYSTCVEGDFQKGRKYLRNALAVSKELSDNLSAVIANYWLGHQLAICCEFDKAQFHMEEALKINEAMNVIYGISQMKSNLSVFIYVPQGRIDLGYRTSGEALSLAEESGDIFLKPFACFSHGVSCYCKGSLYESEKLLLKSIGLARKIDHFVWEGLARWYLGEVYFDMAKYKKSYANHAKAASILEFGSIHPVHPYLVSLNRIASARAKVMNNEKDVDLETLYGYATGSETRQYKCWMSKYVGEILLNIDVQYIEEAGDWIKRAMEADRCNGMMWRLGRDYVLHADWFSRKGDASRAREDLNKAIDIFQECGADGWVKRTEERLAQL